MVRSGQDEAVWWAAEYGSHGETAIWSPPDPSWTAGETKAHVLGHMLRMLGGIPKGASILDLGCGIGRLTIPAARAWPWLEFCGVDSCHPIIAAAACRSAAEDINNVEWRLGDGRVIPYHDGRFDAGWSVAVFQHLEADAARQYVAEISRVLRPGGQFRLQWTVGPTNSHYAQDHDPWRIHRWAEQAGLSHDDIETDSYYPTWRWVTCHK